VAARGFEGVKVILNINLESEECLTCHE
jgi:hypothetical protein